MRAVYKASSDKCRFRAENLSVNLIKCLAAEIIVTVSGRSRKAGIGYTVILKCRHDLFGVVFCCFINLIEFGPNPFFRLFSQRIDLILDVRYLHLSAP